MEQKEKALCLLPQKAWGKEENILITSKPFVKKRKRGREKVVLRNIPLHHHPNPDKEGQFHVIPRNYLDDSSSFEDKVYNWKWQSHDKRKIKHIKKQKIKS